LSETSSPRSHRRCSIRLMSIGWPVKSSWSRALETEPSLRRESRVHTRALL
jgi:hypothetical protein